MALADVASLQVTAKGYVPFTLHNYPFQLGPMQHRIALQPNCPDFLLAILDRSGNPLQPRAVQLLGEQNEDLLTIQPSTISSELLLPDSMLSLPAVKSFTLPRTPKMKSNQDVRQYLFPGVRPGKVHVVATFGNKVTAEGWFQTPKQAADRLTVYLNKSLAEIQRELEIEEQR